MRKKLLAVLLVVAILATAGIVAAKVNTTEASVTSPAEQTGIPIRDGADQSESTTKPFVGIAITSAPENGDTDGALIVRVVEGSPADGILQADDIITALDGVSVSGPKDVVRIVREHAPGDTVVFTLERNGASMDVSITLGERDSSAYDGRRSKRSGYGPVGFARASERLVLSDTRYMTDDGVKTVRKAFGTAQNLDTDAGTFDLLLRDDSETLSFTIDDDTKIAVDNVEGEASLSDLSADGTTMVVQVTQPDGASQVQSVVQGEYSLTVHSIFGRSGFDRMHGFGEKDSNGFSPRKFFFGWFGDREGDNRNGNQERRGNRHN